MNLGERFAQVANAGGFKVHKAVLLGKWLHIDTNQDQEPALRAVLAQMGAKQVKTLQPAADGKHLDGSRHHRLVATF